MKKIRRFLFSFTFQFTKVFFVLLFAVVTFLATTIYVSAQIAPADIYVSMTTLEFFPTVVGMSDARILKIYNLGEADLLVESMNIIQDPAFSIDYNDVNVFPCGSADPTIISGEYCSVKIKFTPTILGEHTSILRITSNDPDEGETDVDLIGEATGAPDIEVDPLTIDFGSVLVGESSSPVEITITNNGSGALYPVAYLSDYTNFGLNEFGGSNPCDTGTVLNGGGAYCTMQVWYKPSIGGSLIRTLTITSNDPDEPEINVNLFGEAPFPPDIDVSPTAIDFGYVLVGESSSDVEITIQNTGIGDLYPSLTNLSDHTNFGYNLFGGSNPCGSDAVVNGSSECTMTALFEPASAGIFSETLTITSNDPDESEVEVTLDSAGCSSFLITESQWYEIQDIPKGTKTVIILATLTNKDSLGRDLSFSEETFQLWGYTVDPEADVVGIPKSSIKIVEEPTGTIVQDSEFIYHLEVNLSGLPYMPRLGFRVVTVEGGTMRPSDVPVNENCVINIKSKAMPWMPLLLDD